MLLRLIIYQKLNKMKQNLLFNLLYIIGLIYFFITKDYNIILGCGIFGIINKVEVPFDYTTFSVLGINNDSRGGDSCGVYIDGQVEYGVDKEKLFEDFMYNSVLVQTTETCKIALGHCRKASVGKVALETAQPVCIYNSENKIEFVLLHNGTIHNYEELAEKYIPNIDIKGMTDSQVMARIFYYKGFDALAEYNGGAVFVIVDYRKGEPRTYLWKGASPKTAYQKTLEEERPLYISKDKDELVFSSIAKYIPALRPYNELKTIPCNCLLGYKDGVLYKLKDYDRSSCQQSKKCAVTTYSNDSWNDNWYSQSTSIDQLHYRYLLNHKPINGKFWISRYGTVFKNKPSYGADPAEICFFEGIPIVSEEAYNLIVEYWKKSDLEASDFVAIFENIIRYMSYDQVYLDETNHCVKATSPTTWINYDGEHQFIGQSVIRTFAHGMQIDSKPCFGKYPDVTKNRKIDIKMIKKIWKPLM